MDIYITILLTILIICILSTYVYLPFVTVTGGNFNKCNSQPKINFDKLKIFSKEKLQLISNMNFEKINMLSNLDEDNLNFLLNLDNDKFNTFINLDNQKFDTIMKLDNQKLGELINLDNQKFDTLMKLDNQKFDSLVNLDNQKLNNLINLDSKKLGDLINLDYQKFDILTKIDNQKINDLINLDNQKFETLMKLDDKKLDDLVNLDTKKFSDLIKLENEELDTLIYLDNDEFNNIIYPKMILNDETYFKNIDDYLKLYPKQEKNVRKRRLLFDEKEKILEIKNKVDEEVFSEKINLLPVVTDVREENLNKINDLNIKIDYDKIINVNEEQIDNLNVQEKNIINQYILNPIVNDELKYLKNKNIKYDMIKTYSFLIDSPDMYYYNLIKDAENIDCIKDTPIIFEKKNNLPEKIIYEFTKDSYQIRKDIYIKEEDIFKYLNNKNISEKKVLLSKISELVGLYLNYLNNYYSIFFDVNEKLLKNKYKFKELDYDNINNIRKYEFLANYFFFNISEIKKYILYLPDIISKEEIFKLKNKLYSFRGEQIEMLKKYNYFNKINIRLEF